MIWRQSQPPEDANNLSLARNSGGEGLQRAFAEEPRAARGSKQRRRPACRDAMVDWLYSRDAVSSPGVIRETMLQDLQRGYWFAEPFSDDDLDSAAAWLSRQGLAGGTGSTRHMARSSCA